jgi:hypothetical protein
MAQNGVGPVNPENPQDNPDKESAKIWCPDRENFQYVKVCDSNCKKKQKCSAFRAYCEPILF